MLQSDLLPVGPLHSELADFLAAGDFSATAYHQTLITNGTPLVEPGALTFLWFGDAERVELVRWINAGVDRLQFSRVAASDLWQLRVPVQDGGRFEYKLNIGRSGHEDWILDPGNPNRAGDPFGQNSVAMTHGYVQPDWSVSRNAPRGRIEDLIVQSSAFGHSRTEKVYLPYDYDAAEVYPLVIVHDGGDYDNYANLTITLDNLIDEGAIPPIIAVMIQTNDRIGEYAHGRRHARYVVNELLPAVEASFGVSADPKDCILMGASLGAVASLSTAYRYPDVFGGLVLKSGSFVFDRQKLQSRPHPVFLRTARLVDMLKRAPGLVNTKAFVSTGELEGLESDNRSLAKLLAAKGTDVRFQSSWDGHHWHNWRDQIRDALRWVLRGDDKI